MDGLSVEELEMIMNSTEITDVENLELPKDEQKPESYTNFNNLKKDAEAKAKQIIKKLVSFHFTKEMLKDQYAKQKIQFDIISLTNLIFQLNTSQMAIQKLLEEIDGGGIHPRNFEVLGQLQKSNLEILKYNKQGLQVMESEYRSFAEEFKHKQEQKDVENFKQLQNNPEIEQPLQLPTGSKNTKVYRGTINLLKDLEKEENIKTFSEDEIVEISDFTEAQ